MLSALDSRNDSQVSSTISSCRAVRCLLIWTPITGRLPWRWRERMMWLTHLWWIRMPIRAKRSTRGYWDSLKRISDKPQGLYGTPSFVRRA